MTLEKNNIWWLWGDGGGLVAKWCPSPVTPWTIACQAPLSMGFPRQKYWNGLPFPPPGNLPNSGMESESSALAGILLHFRQKILYLWATREVQGGDGRSTKKQDAGLWQMLRPFSPRKAQSGSTQPLETGHHSAQQLILHQEHSLLQEPGVRGRGTRGSSTFLLWN